MSNLSQFIGGGKLCTQEFLASGTFTPSTRLLALGGVVLIEALAGAGSGAIVCSTGGTTQASGGDCGQFVESLVTVTGPVIVTIGAGGAPYSLSAVGNHNGNDGSDTSFGALVVAKGGMGGAYRSSPSGTTRGGMGIAEAGRSVFDGSGNLLDGRGGRGRNGRGGGGSAAGTLIPENLAATDGAGAGRIFSIPTLIANVYGYSATPNSGAGGGGISASIPSSFAGYSVFSGAGATGWLRATWFE